MKPVKRLMNLAIAATASVGLLASTAAPAMADRKSDNMLKALLGIAVLGAIIHETKKDKRPAPPVVAPPPPVVVVPDYRADLPRACVVAITGLRGEHMGYGESCLIDYGYTTRLPRHCAHDTRINGRPDRIFATNCLADAGFRARRNY